MNESVLGAAPAAILISLGGLAVGIVQYLKWAGLPDKWGPFLVVAVAVVLEALWALTSSSFRKELILGYLFDVATITFTAAGIYGYSRSVGSGSVTNLRSPPSGAMEGRN